MDFSLVFCGTSSWTAAGYELFLALLCIVPSVVVLREGVTLMGSLRNQWSHGLRRLRARKVLNAEEVQTDAATLLDGQVVRLCGTVEADDPSPARGRAPSPVLAETLTMGALGEVIDRSWEGSDFYLRLGDGERVRVDVASALRTGALQLLDAGALRWRGKPLAVGGRGRFWQSRLLPGDFVEVLGQLRREVDPGARGGGHRSLPMGWTLEPPPGGSLLLWRSVSPGLSIELPEAPVDDRLLLAEVPRPALQGAQGALDR